MLPFFKNMLISPKEVDEYVDATLFPLIQKAYEAYSLPDYKLQYLRALYRKNIKDFPMFKNRRTERCLLPISVALTNSVVFVDQENPTAVYKFYDPSIQIYHLKQYIELFTIAKDLALQLQNENRLKVDVIWPTRIIQSSSGYNYCMEQPYIHEDAGAIGSGKAMSKFNLENSFHNFFVYVLKKHYSYTNQKVLEDLERPRVDNSKMSKDGTLQVTDLLANIENL